VAAVPAISGSLPKLCPKSKEPSAQYWARALKLDPKFFDGRADRRAAWEESKGKAARKRWG
jgi:hypothetical protein